MGPHDEQPLDLLKLSEAKCTLETLGGKEKLTDLLVFLGLFEEEEKETLAHEAPTKSERPYLRLLK